MTLPFRRRHNDAEAAHDRARSLSSEEMLAPLPEPEATWLGRHLDGCTECRRDRDAFLADRELLRNLRETAPEPPRDLWARTAAALDREAGHPSAVAAQASARRRLGWGVAPLGAAAGTLVVLIVIGTAMIPRPVPPGTTPPNTSGALNPTERPGATPFGVDAGPVRWLQTASDGSVELVTGIVEEVCPKSDPRCTPNRPGASPKTVDLGRAPTSVTLAPGNRSLAVASAGDEAEPNKIFVVALSESIPGESPLPSIVVTPVPASAGPTITAEPASPDPGTPSPSVVPSPTPGETPPNGVEILSGVDVVGDLAYSEDGRWLAFSAKPSDGSAGPDLYLWTPGTDEATRVTSDHQTYFSAWLDGQVLASRVVLTDQVEPRASGEPGHSPAPAATEPAATTEPSTDDPAEPSGLQVAGAASFLLDPATFAITDLFQPNVWLPVVNEDADQVAYWSGTLRSDDGIAWQPHEGDLVLDGWAAGDPALGESPRPSSEASAAASPDATVDTRVGPIGQPTPIVEGTTAAFKASFDAEGSHLAVWVTEDASDPVGRLHLLVLDPETGAVAPEPPLVGEPALGRFSLEARRLAWVSPSGQDGAESAVKVLAWAGDDFGEIQTFPARELLIVN